MQKNKYFKPDHATFFQILLKSIYSESAKNSEKISDLDMTFT